MESGFNYWFYDVFEGVWFYGVFERVIYDNELFKYYVINQNGKVRNYIASDIIEYVQDTPSWLLTRT